MELQGKANIDFPCEWTYTVIGLEKNLIISAIKSIVGERPHLITESKSSKTGKYVSLHLQMTVLHREEFDGFYALLGKHEAIKMVM
jgi:putative lipoic acid-binding regulatory protein